jgi:hypothetical protein
VNEVPSNEIAELIAAALLLCALLVAIIGIVVRRLVPMNHPSSRALFSNRSMGSDLGNPPQFVRLRLLLPFASLPSLDGLPASVKRLMIAMRLIAIASLLIVVWLGLRVIRM